MTRLTIVAFACSLSMAAYAMADSPRQINVPAGDLVQALESLARQADVSLVYQAQQMTGIYTRGVSGNLTPQQAVTKLLHGTKLRVRTDAASGAMLIEVPAEKSPTAFQRSTTRDSTQEGTKSSDTFRMAQVDQGAPAAVSTEGTSSQSAQESVRLEQVIVTAQKREERQQDVPVAMTVLDTQALAENNQVRFADYFASVPGLNLSSNAAGGGTTYFTIRGLSAGYAQNPTVATLIDGVPTTASVSRPNGAITSPELDPSDLARIEVLKGPQGTLYGADSLGGLINYVTADPSTTKFGGRIEAVGLDIPDGAAGYALRAAVNVPVSDQFALRLSALDRHDPGYIDEMTTGQKNFNSAHAYGGHFGFLWKPYSTLSIKINGTVQETDGNNSFFDADASGRSLYGSRLALTAIPGATTFADKDQLYSATINWEAAGFDVTSVTGYVVNSWEDDQDRTQAFSGLAYDCLVNPTTCMLSPGQPSGSEDVKLTARNTTRKYSEEVRVGSRVGRWLEWRVGGFYTNEDSTNNGSLLDYNPVTLANEGVAYGIADTILKFDEYAIFGDATLHLTNRFDIGLGMRQSWQEQKDLFYSIGGFNRLFWNAPPTPYFGYPLETSNGRSFTYKITPKYKISDDVMFYGNIATGYRIGGYNYSTVQNAAYDVPLSYAPDTTTSYELGIKAELIPRVLSFDASMYYIDWKNIQIDVTRFLTAPGRESLNVDYTTNGGHAKSEGLEFSLEAHPLQGLTVTAEGSYDDAVLTQDLPSGSNAYGVKGDRLPYSMRFAGGFTVNQDVRLTDRWVGFMGGAVNYVGSRPYEFTTPGVNGKPLPRLTYPAYSQINFHAGARGDAVTVNVFLNNVTNARGIVGLIQGTNANTGAGYLTSTIQPRTLGISVARVFR